MRIRTLLTPILLLLPSAAIAAAPGEAYQTGYRLGQVAAQALPFVAVAVVVGVAVWLLVRARSKRKRSRNAEPQA